MKTNIGTIDKIARIVFAVSVVILYSIGAIGGTTAAVLGSLAVIMAVTGLVSFCPLYLPLHISTKKQ
jgi:hypothetical protein